MIHPLDWHTGTPFWIAPKRSWHTLSQCSASGWATATWWWFRGGKHWHVVVTLHERHQVLKDIMFGVKSHTWKQIHGWNLILFRGVNGGVDAFDHLQCHKSSTKDGVFPRVCSPPHREKWDTPAALQTLCSYIASFFTPCQTPLSPLLTEQQQPLTLSSMSTLKTRGYNPTISHIVLSPSCVVS